MVYFVGAGPGAPDLITVRGMRLLGMADTVIYAGSLVNPELLAYAKDGAAVFNSAEMTLGEVLDAVRAEEERGGVTVRLHTGDTALYSTVREQIDELDALGIRWEICPGVSAFSGAAAALGEELTLPGVTQSVVITRAEGRTKVPERESIASLAAHGSTMVFFLSASQADVVERELITGGYPPDTPAAVVFRATWPEQRILRVPLGGLGEAVREAGIRKTALIIVSGALSGGSGYEKSRLYSEDFGTGFRSAGKDPAGDGPVIY